MMARIFLNKAKVSTTSGVKFVSVSMGLGTPPVAQEEVSNLKELKALVLKCLKEFNGEGTVNVSVITRGRAVRGFNAWYDSMPKCIVPADADNIEELKS